MTDVLTYDERDLLYRLHSASAVGLLVSNRPTDPATANGRTVYQLRLRRWARTTTTGGVTRVTLTADGREAARHHLRTHR